MEDFTCVGAPTSESPLMDPSYHSGHLLVVLHLGVKLSSRLSCESFHRGKTICVSLMHCPIESNSIYRAFARAWQ